MLHLKTLVMILFLGILATFAANRAMASIPLPAPYENYQFGVIACEREAIASFGQGCIVQAGFSTKVMMWAEWVQYTTSHPSAIVTDIRIPDHGKYINVYYIYDPADTFKTVVPAK